MRACPRHGCEMTEVGAQVRESATYSPSSRTQTSPPRPLLHEGAPALTSTHSTHWNMVVASLQVFTRLAHLVEHRSAFKSRLTHLQLARRSSFRAVALPPSLYAPDFRRQHSSALDFLPDSLDTNDDGEDTEAYSHPYGAVGWKSP